MAETHTTRYFVGRLLILAKANHYQLDLPSWVMIHRPGLRSVEICAGLDDFSNRVMNNFVRVRGARLQTIRYAASLSREGDEPARVFFEHTFETPPHIFWDPRNARLHIARGADTVPLFRIQDSRDAPEFVALPARPLAHFIH